MTTKLMPTPKEPNPFKVGDKIICIEAGWLDLVEGQHYTVTGITDRCVSWRSNATRGGIWTRFRLANDEEYEYDRDYDEAMRDIEAFELVHRG